jgi:AcrR family transcriptional regulator
MKERSLETRSRGRPRSFQQEELIEKVMRIFWERGYEGVSMDLLCKLTKLSKPSFYNIFASKEELFLTCLQSYHQTYALPLVEKLLLNSDPINGYRAMLESASHRFQDPDLPAGCLILTGALEARGKTKAIDRALDDLQSEMLASLEKYLHRQARLSEKEARTASQFILSQLYTLAMFSRSNPRLLKSADYLKVSQDLFKSLLG